MKPSLPAPTVTTTVAESTVSIPDEPDVIVLGADNDFGSVVAASPEGSHFIIQPGLHRMQEIEPLDGMTFEGLPGAVLSGAVVIDDWVQEGDGVWSFTGLTATGFEHGACIEGYEGCRLSQDLYMDDVMLWQVTDREDLESGTWLWEGDRILVADDPFLRRVEVSIATHAFFGLASNITIRNLIIEKYAVPAQFGVIQSEALGGGDLATGWLVEDTEIRLSHGAAVRMGNDTTLRRLSIHDNGQLGLAASGGSGGLVEDSHIFHNNLAGFDPGWEGGGAKFKETTGLVVRRNTSENNIGPGFWTDIDNVDTLYEDNIVTGNSGPGIFHEISYAAVIRNNTIRGNGTGYGVWMWGAGILIAASRDTEVYGNIVEGNANGIGLIQQNRGEGSFGPWLVQNVSVHDNTVSGGKTGAVQDNEDSSIYSAGNTFTDNTYHGAVTWAWNGNERMGWAAWQATGNDVTGTYSQ